MLAQELDAADLNKRVLFCTDDLLVILPVFSAPISSWGSELFVFYFDDLANQCEPSDVHLLAHAFGVEQGHEC